MKNKFLDMIEQFIHSDNQKVFKDQFARDLVSVITAYITDKKPKEKGMPAYLADKEMKQTNEYVLIESDKEKAYNQGILDYHTALIEGIKEQS